MGVGVTDDELTALLWDWGRYWIAGNRGEGSRLVGSYAERIAKDAWGNDYVPDIDERVIYLASAIRGFDANYRAALHVKYVEPGPLKQKLPRQWTRSDYYVFLKAAHLKAMDAMSDKKGVATIPPNL